MKFGEYLHRWPALSLLLLALLSAFSTTQIFPLQYDFSFTSLFVGEGEGYDRLRDYLNRFGSDVQFVVVSVESDALYSTSVMGEIEALTDALESIEGIDEVVSPTNVTDLVGDGGSLRTETLMPSPLPTTDAEWQAVRETATGHPLLNGTVFSEDGEHAALLVRFGRESGPEQCTDGVDNDAAGGIDCHDSACRAASAQGVCDVTADGTEADNAACTNGVDDDDDGVSDCLDPDCAGLLACRWVHSDESSRALCSDGLDNDGDGDIDCLDADCLLNPDVPSCSTTIAITERVHALDARARAEGWGALYLGGIPVISDEYTRVIQHDMTTYLPLTAVFVGLVLFALFRSVRGVVLPMFVVGLGVLWAMAALMGSGGKLNMINSSMPTLLMVIAVADSVHILSRYLEESEDAESSPEATRRAMRHMMSACLLTSVTSAVGFASLLSARLPIIRSFGFYTGVAIVLSYVVTMLLMPPVLARLPLPTAKDRARSRAGEALARHVTGLFVTLVTKHRRWAVGITLLITAVSLGGIVQVRADSKIMQELRPDNLLAIANAQIEAHHGGVLSGAIVFHGPPGAFAEPDALRALDELAVMAEDWRWEGEPLVSSAVSLVDVVKEAHAEYRGDEASRSVPDTRAAVVSLLDQLPADQRASLASADYSTVHMTFRMYSLGSRAWAALRADLTAEVEAHPALGDDWYFTGSSTLGQDAMRFMTRDLLTSLLLAVVIIMVLMSVLFRSVWLGFISMIPNAFPLFVTMAVVGYLGIDIRVSTAVVFSISLGIAVDDTIHVLVRFREEVSKAGAGYDEAMIRAIDGAGRGVVYTTVMLCIGFGTLSMSEFTAVRELGMLGGVTLASALVGDLLVLPLVVLWLRPKVRLGDQADGASG